MAKKKRPSYKPMPAEQQAKILNQLSEKEFDKLMKQAQQDEPQKVFQRAERPESDETMSLDGGAIPSGLNVQFDDNPATDSDSSKDLLRQLVRDTERIRELLERTLEE